MLNAKCDVFSNKQQLHVQMYYSTWKTTLKYELHVSNKLKQNKKEKWMRSID